MLFTERWRHLTYSNEPTFINNVLLVAKEYISTSNFQMSLNALICMESYYFHVYSVSCDVHFRYNGDAYCGQHNTSPKLCGVERCPAQQSEEEEEEEENK